jgi:ATP-dependent Clp protease ATP-binding subunit ClpC
MQDFVGPAFCCGLGMPAFGPNPRRMWEPFDENARLVVVGAQQEAQRLGHDCIGPEHLLLAILANTNPTSELLRKHGIEHDKLRIQVERLAAPRGSSAPEEMVFTPVGKRCFERAFEAARALKCSHISSEHLFIAITFLGDESVAMRALSYLAPDVPTLRAEVTAQVKGSNR